MLRPPGTSAQLPCWGARALLIPGAVTITGAGCSAAAQCMCEELSAGGMPCMYGGVAGRRAHRGSRTSGPRGPALPLSILCDACECWQVWSLPGCPRLAGQRLPPACSSGPWRWLPAAGDAGIGAAACAVRSVRAWCGLCAVLHGVGCVL